MFERLLQSLMQGEFADAAQIAAVLLGVLASLAGVIAALTEMRWRRVAPTHGREDVSNRDQLELQIEDIRDYLRRQEHQAAANGLTNIALNVSQYGVGAALVTSFVSENLNAQALGVLGVVTLLSSFTQQLVRPGIKRAAATRRAVRLREMLRRAEIALAETAGKSGQSQLRFDHTKAFLAELHAVQLDDAD